MKTVNMRSQIYFKKLQLTERKLLLKVLKERFNKNKMDFFFIPMGIVLSIRLAL